MVENNPRILVVDDDKTSRVLLTEFLQQADFDVFTAEDGKAAIEILKREPFDLMLIDLQMEGMSGLDVIQIAADASPEMATIILTAQGSMESAIQALRYRVQDYLVKPVSTPEILDSIHRALDEKKRIHSRIAERKAPIRMTTPRVYELNGGIRMDLNRRRVFWNGQSIQLTPTEEKILRLLLERVNRSIPHSELVFKTLGYELPAEEAARILRPIISRLRKKLSAVPDGESWIKSLRGEGYMFEMG